MRFFFTFSSRSIVLTSNQFRVQKSNQNNDIRKHALVISKEQTKMRILCYSLDHRGQIWSCADNRRGQQANGHRDRPLIPLRDRQQGEVLVIHGGRLSYGCIYKTHFFPIMSGLQELGGPTHGPVKSISGPSNFTRLQPDGPLQNKICVCLDKRDTKSP